MNATLAADIAELAAQEHPELKYSPKIRANTADLARVRESLKHFVRDWSEVGKQERERTFAPILNLLSRIEPEQRDRTRILVPGSGLGRLAWEISQLGFDTTANELSYFMILAFRLLLSPDTTQEIKQHKIRPYAHWFSHQRTTENIFRSVSFPDVVPRLGPNFQLLEDDFLKIPMPAGTWSSDQTQTPTHSSQGYDYIVTLFFIDTSFNAFATMEQIYKLLKPGGSWVNLGPLLWSGGGQSRVELSLEELLAAAEEIGFIISRPSAEHRDHPEQQRTVECEYTADPNAMMRWTYKTEFWVAKKPQ
ncbi:hypothetical protein EST38_g854 [Candolleomyces aberdarensis]|uniref:Uncharacterized protein n=1 Tax=Candolleomyces aberdarensis TaxID=2316362 RepID=A0A4Q2E031_9AGAR|nr:hypothetical protein EST38_g854 [Candolleomyces aberdarensis]